MAEHANGLFKTVVSSILRWPINHRKLQVQTEGELRFTLVLASSSTMAEISEAPPPPAAETPQAATTTSEFNPDTMRTTKPGIKRLSLTFSVFLSFLLGFPLLWKSVEIYRSPLPFDEMDALSNHVVSHPLRFPCHFQAVFVDFDADPHDLERSLIAGVTQSTSTASGLCGTCADSCTVSVTVDSASHGCSRSTAEPQTDTDKERSCFYKCGGIRASDFAFGGGDDEGVDERLGEVLGGGGCLGRVYSVVVVNGVGAGEGVRMVVGKYRHGWIEGREMGAEAGAMVEKVAEMFVKVFANGGREEGVIHGEFMPVGADGRIVLSFNLLNADPHDWVYDW